MVAEGEWHAWNAGCAPWPFWTIPAGKPPSSSLPSPFSKSLQRVFKVSLGRGTQPGVCFLLSFRGSQVVSLPWVLTQVVMVNFVCHLGAQLFGHMSV